VTKMCSRELKVRERLLKERAKFLESVPKEPPAFENGLKRAGEMKVTFHIPVDEHRDCDVIGLIIGHRGNTQKRIEQETGAKIAIRGKKGFGGKKKALEFQPSDDESLHVVVAADNQESLEKAVKMVNALLCL
jgi:splicing factor 1